MPSFAHPLTPSHATDSAPDWRPAALRFAMQHADDAQAVDALAAEAQCGMPTARHLIQAARVVIRNHAHIREWVDEALSK